MIFGTNYTLLLLILLLVSGFALYLRLKSRFGKMPGSKEMNNLVVLEVQISRNEEADTNAQMASLCAENMFASIHGLLREDSALQEHVSFEIISSGASGIKFLVCAPFDVIKFVESQLYAQYPSASIKQVKDYISNTDLSNSKYEIATITLTKPTFFPIKTFRDFEIDPLSSFTSSLSHVEDTDEIWFQVMARPIPDVWQKDGLNYVESVRLGMSGKGDGIIKNVFGVVSKEAKDLAVNILTGAFSYRETADPRFAPKSVAGQVRLSPTQELEISSIENKLSKMGFEVNIRVMSSSDSEDRMKSNLRSVLALLKQYSTPISNTFSSNISFNSQNSLTDIKERKFISSQGFILTDEELATIYHLPSTGVETPNISWTYSRKSEPPSNLPVKDCVYIGDTIFRNEKVRFGMNNDEDRLRHLYVIGKTGTGKSTLLEAMIHQDIANGFGVGVLDPHGETIDHVLDRIPDNRIDDVIYFDPSDTEYPVGLNLLEMDDPSQKNLMASGLVAAIHQHFDYSWGPRLEYLLNYCVLTLLDVPGTTLLGITRLLEDKNYQKYILHQVKDPVVNRFWEKEYKEMTSNQKLVTEAIAPIQNKVNRFLASTTIRNILGQRKSTIKIKDAMDNKKILLMNLSKGKIGSDNANLLGALLVSRIQFYALQRARVSSNERTPFYLYVDEFQNFATGSFEEILSESRKYKLGLYLTNQYIGQLSEELQKAVFGNVGTIVALGLGAGDAKIMEKEFVPYFTADDLITLEKFQAYIKLLIGGMTSLPFSCEILIPWKDDYMIKKRADNKARAIEVSRAKYGVDRAHVEEKINKWVETPFDKGMAIAQQYKKDTNLSQIGDERNESK